MEKIGVIGLGRMGSAIAQRISNEGGNVRGWTRSGRVVSGVTSAPDIQTLVDESDTLVLSLFDSNAVAEILDELLTHDLDGKHIIETSTVTPNILIDRHDQIEAKGATAVDAPISGGPEMVLAGVCGIFIGGEETAAATARNSLAPISGRIFHVGPLGTGLVMKAINNGMIQIYTKGLAELLPLASKAGLPLETALKILSGGPAGMPLIADRIPKILGEDDTVGFQLLAAFKDNVVIRSILESYGLPSPSLEAFASLEKIVREQNLLEKDPAALLRWSYIGDKAG